MDKIKIVAPQRQAGMAGQREYEFGATPLEIEVSISCGRLTFVALNPSRDLVNNSGSGPTPEQLALLKSALCEALAAIEAA